MKRLLIIVFFIASSIQIYAQYVGAYEVNKGNCDFFIKDKNWPDAVKCFSELLVEDSLNSEFKYQLAKGYTYADIDKSKALQLLQDLDSLGFAADDFSELLADANFYNNNFDAAKTIYEELVKVTEEPSKYKKRIAQCDFAKKMMLNPIAVQFENLGKNVNSEAPDFLPFVNPDESNIYFTTKREGVVGNVGSSEGYKTADIYYVKHKRDKYSRARSIGSPNTLGNEFTTGNTENGMYMLFMANNEQVFYDLYISELGRRSYMAPEALKYESLNKSAEQGVSMSNDGRKLYFSSDIEGGFGGYDIYVIKKLPNGEWGQPQNLGSTINTEGDEMYPTITDNGKTLYFSSNNHLGMGDMDLFLSKRAEDDATKWSEPLNLGYPINTPYNDLNISFAKNKRYAYMAKRFDDTFGDLDIYRLTFLNEKEDYTLLTGRVLDQDSALVAQKVTVEILNEETGVFVGSYLKNQKILSHSCSW